MASYEGSFKIYVFPVINKDKQWEPPIDMSMGCHTVAEADKQYQKMIRDYPNRRIVLIQSAPVMMMEDPSEETYQTKVIAIA